MPRFHFDLTEMQCAAERAGVDVWWFPFVETAVAVKPLGNDKFAIATAVAGRDEDVSASKGKLLALVRMHDDRTIIVNGNGRNAYAIAEDLCNEAFPFAQRNVK
jgi:hypothetical protein